MKLPIITSILLFFLCIVFFSLWMDAKVEVKNLKIQNESLSKYNDSINRKLLEVGAWNIRMQREIRFINSLFK